MQPSIEPTRQSSSASTTAKQTALISCLVALSREVLALRASDSPDKETAGVAVAGVMEVGEHGAVPPQ